MNQICGQFKNRRVGFAVDVTYTTKEYMKDYQFWYDIIVSVFKIGKKRALKGLLYKEVSIFILFFWVTDQLGHPNKFWKKDYILFTFIMPLSFFTSFSRAHWHTNKNYNKEQGFSFLVFFTPWFLGISRLLASCFICGCAEHCDVSGENRKLMITSLIIL